MQADKPGFRAGAAWPVRRGDAVKVGRPHLRDGAIRITTEKTGERVSIAATDDLLEAIATSP